MMAASLMVQIYTICAGVLICKFFYCARRQAVMTAKAGGRPPEDDFLAKKINAPKQAFYGMINKREELDNQMKKRHQDHARWMRILMNDIESLPFAFFIFGGGIFAEANTNVHIGAMLTYTVARCLHTIAFAKAMQPHRVIAYTIGILAILVGAGNAIVGAYNV